MNEWSRVLLHPKRLGLLLGIVLLCGIMFWVSRIGDVWYGAWDSMMLESRITGNVIEEYREMEPNKIQESLVQKQEKLTDILHWIVGMQDMSQEEVLERLAEYPEEGKWIDDQNELYRRLQVYWNAYDELLRQVEYLQFYPSYLDRIREQAKKQSQSKIFGNKNSFSYRNIQKTAEEFENLRGNMVEYGNNRAIEFWVNYRLSDYLYGLFLIVILSGFFEERKKGLWGTVRSCCRGRKKLCVIRVGILAAAAVIGVLMLYGVNLLLALAMEGGWKDFGRSLQSVPIFQKCPLKLTIGQWIAQYFCVKCVAGFLLGLIFWFILDCVSNIQFSMTVLGGILVGEYMLFTFLPVQSIWNPLKYFNVFSYIHISTLYTEYLNMDFLGYPVGIRALALNALPVLTVICFLGILWSEQRRYPEGRKDMLGRFALLWGRCADKIRKKFPIGGMELYKAMLLEYGIVLLILVWFICGHLKFFRGKTIADGMIWYQAYLEAAEGPIDREMEEYLDEAYREAGTKSELTMSLDMLGERIEELKRRAEAGGYEPWLVDEQIYENIYGSKVKHAGRQNGAIALSMVVLCCAALIAYENQSGVVPLVKSLPRGRKKLFTYKFLVCTLMVTIVWAMVYMLELWYFMKNCTPAALDAPVQNLDMLRNFPWKIRIGTYMAILYSLRWLMLMGAGWVSMWIGSRASNIGSACMLNIGLLGIPAILYAIGIEPLGWICPVIPIAAIEPLYSLGKSGNMWELSPYAVWLGISATALWRSWKEWCIVSIKSEIAEGKNE